MCRVRVRVPLARLPGPLHAGLLPEFLLRFPDVLFHQLKNDLRHVLLFQGRNYLELCVEFVGNLHGESFHIV